METNMPTNDDSLYLQAMKEVDSKDRQEGLWAKALTHEKGNAEQAKYRYVQLRVEQLQFTPEISRNSPIQPEPSSQKEPNKQYVTDIHHKKLPEKYPTAYSYISNPTNLTNYTVVALVLLAAMTAIAVISGSSD